MDFSQLKKLEAVDARVRKVDDDRVVTAIVKVKKANYHPHLLAVRSQVDKWIFTAEFKVRNLRDLESDPLVETISLAQALPSY
ncbi:hypothetical protein CSQ96_17035 [Janthinobacterium sp. BJB412]|jgi:hypothetical protein|nr:hypothetical protein CSQ96_17035 [Janthinobacterium sp. BJB412]